MGLQIMHKANLLVKLIILEMVLYANVIALKLDYTNKKNLIKSYNPKISWEATSPPESRNSNAV